MKVLVGAFNQEKALVEAFSVITNLRVAVWTFVWSSSVGRDTALPWDHDGWSQHAGDKNKTQTLNIDQWLQCPLLQVATTAAQLCTGSLRDSDFILRIQIIIHNFCQFSRLGTWHLALGTRLCGFSEAGSVELSEVRFVPDWRRLGSTTDRVLSSVCCYTGNWTKLSPRKQQKQNHNNGKNYSKIRVHPEDDHGQEWINHHEKWMGPRRGNRRRDAQVADISVWGLEWPAEPNRDNWNVNMGTGGEYLHWSCQQDFRSIHGKGPTRACSLLKSLTKTMLKSVFLQRNKTNLEVTLDRPGPAAHAFLVVAFLCQNTVVIC